VQERLSKSEKSLSKLLLAKADRKLFSLILQLVRVPCFDLQSGKVCDSLSAVSPPLLFVSFTCSFSFETIRLELCDLHFSHGLRICGTSGWWWCLWFMNGASTEGR
jgi:hypothetical protein